MLYTTLIRWRFLKFPKDRLTKTMKWTNIETLGHFALDDRSRRETQWYMEQEHFRWVVPATLELIAYDMLFPHSVTIFLKMDKSINIFLIRLFFLTLLLLGNMVFWIIFWDANKWIFYGFLVSPMVKVISLALTSFKRYNLNIHSMPLIFCKECGEYRYLTPLHLLDYDWRWY